MGFSKEEKSRRILRGFKTVFFLVTMVISFLVFSAPVFLVIADTILPSALLSASLSPPSLQTLYSHFANYDFRNSLIDIPLISIIRSAIIICKCTPPAQKLSSSSSSSFYFSGELNFCVIGFKFGGVGVYSFCDGPKLSRGPYLGTTMICCVSSLMFVSVKASYASGWSSGREGSAMETALFICSLALAIAHIIVAYRTSCRERRKLLVYKIDIEA
ncbi:hypothetical protein Gotri_026323, partial [Gossypium trilobum]|nr:hypothetical protein [Gossypium trilobum]